jgi:hypothetical protein
MNNFMRGGLKEGFVKAGAYGRAAVIRRAERGRDQSADDEGRLRHLRGR